MPIQMSMCKSKWAGAMTNEHRPGQLSAGQYKHRVGRIDGGCSGVSEGYKVARTRVDIGQG